MTAYELKLLNYQKFLIWIKDNLSTEEPRPIIREPLAEQLQIYTSVISRSLLMLTQHGYLKKYPQTPNLTAASYQLTGDIDAVTPALLDGWVTKYNQESSQRSAAKKAQETQPTTELTSAYKQQTIAQLEPVTALTLAFTRTETKEIESDEQLSPAQRLLKQAQALLDEENRLKAEQEEQRAKQAQAPPTPDSLNLFEARLTSAEQKLATLLSFFTQAYQALQDLTPTEAEHPTEEPVEPTTRTLLIRLVNSFAAASQKSEHDTWKHLYGQYDIRAGFNVYAHAPTKGERNYLSIFEKHGRIDSLYVMAKKLFVLPELR